MFCFCLQSSLLKLQALDVEGGSSQGTQQPLVSDGTLSPSPHHSPQRSSPGGEIGGGGDGSEGGGGGGGALLQLLAGLPSPLPSPRCCSPSLRFNSDPDTAPSPPCSQQYMLCRSLGDRTEVSEDECPASIPFLTRHIQSLKKRVRRFEDQFEQEMNYKPSHNDKYSNPEMIRVMSELAKARKQLKGKKCNKDLSQLIKKKKKKKETDLKSGSGQQGASDHKPSLEETVESLFRRLREKRQSLGLPDNMKVCGTKQEKNLVKPLYDRYQMIKRLLCASPTITTIVRNKHTHANSSRCLLECLRQTRAEKKIRRKVLREFEDEFYRQTGRVCQKEDRTPIKEEYQEYKQLKAKLRLLEVLLSKQDVTQTP
uniref:Protein FAM13A-like n=1 Tax=Poecilia latipinna TaxID=48699 RepID=A0A3B3V2U0_9TELE